MSVCKLKVGTAQRVFIVERQEEVKTPCYINEFLGMTQVEEKVPHDERQQQVLFLQFVLWLMSQEFIKWHDIVG